MTPRKRIHELAKEWGTSVPAILAQLEKMGVTGKKPQSVLTEEERGRVKVGLGLTPAPIPVCAERSMEGCGPCSTAAGNA
jgi:hypothetical protein